MTGRARIYRSVNYETTCLMTRPDPTRCKFSMRGWSFKPSPWLPYHCHSSRTALISASSTRHPPIDFPRTFCPTLPFSHPDTGAHFSVIRYLFLIFPLLFFLSSLKSSRFLSHNFEAKGVSGASVNLFYFLAILLFHIVIILSWEQIDLFIVHNKVRNRIWKFQTKFSFQRMWETTCLM